MLIHIVVGAILVINRTSRKGNQGRSSFHTLTGHTTNYKSFYALSPSDLTEVHVVSNNDAYHYRSVTAIPLHPCLDNDTDWKFFSLETGMTFIRDYRYAYVMPWSYEARMRMRYLATLMPVNSDQSLLLAATPKEPVLRYEMPRVTRRGRRRRPQDPNQNRNGADAIENRIEENLAHVPPPPLPPPDNNAPYHDMNQDLPVHSVHTR